MRLVLIGKPLSGKGQQAHILEKLLHLPRICPGELIRKEIQKQTPLGKTMNKYVSRGLLVPPKILFPFLKKHLQRNNFILDGFPRSIQQAQLLEKITPPDLAIELVCSKRTIMKRARHRYICLHCGSVYGVDVPAKKKGLCDKCQTRLIQRADDQISVVRKRLTVYEKETRPLRYLYHAQKKYIRVNGEQPFLKVSNKIVQLVRKHKL